MTTWQEIKFFSTEIKWGLLVIAIILIVGMILERYF